MCELPAAPLPPACSPSSGALSSSCVSLLGDAAFEERMVQPRSLSVADVGQMANMRTLLSYSKGV